AVLAALSHADDAAAAHVDAGAAHVIERVEPVAVGARGDDLAVELRRGVEIVVVVVEAGIFQPPRLRTGQHAERRAGLEPERLDALAPRAHSIGGAVLRIAPGRAHAEAARAGALRRLRLGDDRRRVHQLLGLHARLVVRALRTIGAVLRAAAGLDRQE